MMRDPISVDGCASSVCGRASGYERKVREMGCHPQRFRRIIPGILSCFYR